MLCPGVFFLCLVHDTADIADTSGTFRVFDITLAVSLLSCLNNPFHEGRLPLVSKHLPFYV